MNWKQLLSTKRVKGLFGQSSSTPIAGDLRSEFDRDYGRTVFSTPVRRLQDKAQVFPLERHDAVRTRLTHSMEVSSVARSFGDSAERFLFKSDVLTDEKGVLGTIAATCGLVHDLGNPPFGHSGEASIREWFKTHHENDPKFFEGFKPFTDASNPKPEDTQFARDFLRFEGNAQTQRLLSRLQVLADEYGLNLTCGTLSASCKYVAQSNTVDKTQQERKKHGYFASENKLISELRKEVGTNEYRNPIAFLVEASDDIVYSTVDLEDGVKKGVITWEFIDAELRRQLGEDNSLNQALKRARDKIVPAGLHGKAKDEAMAVAFRTFAIAEMVVEALRTFEKCYSDMMSGKYHGELLYDSAAGKLASACKKLGSDVVYVSSETLKLELMGRKVITDLLTCFWEAARAYTPNKKLDGFPAKAYQLISTNYRHIFEKNIAEAGKSSIPEDYFRMQLITDQVSGMTDSYACFLHRELMNA